MNEIDLTEESGEDSGVLPKVRLLRVMYRVFQLNDRELSESLQSFKERKSLLLWDLNNQDAFHLFQVNLIRFLHNYIASAITLRDHTRRLVKKLFKGTEFEQEYEKKKDLQFAKDPLSVFVQRLRVYTLHRTLPITICTLDLDKIETSVSLDVKALREWDDWTVLGNKYLDTLGDEVDLHSIVDSYTSKIEDFYEWFYGRQKQI